MLGCAVYLSHEFLAAMLSCIDAVSIGLFCQISTTHGLWHDAQRLVAFWQNKIFANSMSAGYPGNT